MSLLMVYRLFWLVPASAAVSLFVEIILLNGLVLPADTDTDEHQENITKGRKPTILNAQFMAKGVSSF